MSWQSWGPVTGLVKSFNEQFRFAILIQNAYWGLLVWLAALNSKSFVLRKLFAKNR